jgi:single-stranded DNA-binding protein
MINHVIVDGNLVADPKYVEFGKDGKLLTFTIAHNHTIGETNKVNYFEVQKYNPGKLQDALTKGTAVIVQGQLQQQSWVDKKTDKKVYKIAIVADTLTFMYRQRNAPNRDEGLDNNIM